MQILTSAEMGAVDRRTAEEFGMPLTELMENAGAAVAGFCLRQYAAAERVVVLCGKGNNGGDGWWRRGCWLRRAWMSRCCCWRVPMR
jgi:NAD(P)H-hydrate epimerase